ncbi:hypothetical protein BSKO_00909 [Bryopsis sp. KO-2023]|nr:hypothetical protein BSKO_00909 [Bryopsis sp. KO-2023]
MQFASQTRALGNIPLATRTQRSCRRVRASANSESVPRNSAPPSFEIPGLAEFAAGVTERRKHIPSPSNQDPLLRLFDEFDWDHDGQLTVEEVCKALRSRQIEITEDQAKFFIDAVASYKEKASPRLASRNQFPKLVLHMAESYVAPVAYPHKRYSTL